MERTLAFPVDPWFQLCDPRILSARIALVVGLLLNLRTARRAMAERLE